VEAQGEGSSRRLRYMVEVSRATPIVTKDEEWVVLERKVRSLIKLYLVYFVLLNVSKEKTTTIL